VSAIIGGQQRAGLSFSDNRWTFQDNAGYSACVKTRNEQTVGKRRRRIRMRGSAQATVGIGTIAALPTVLRSLDVDPAALLAEVDIDLAIFDHPENLISYVARNHLLRHCVARTGCEHLGLLVGQQAGLNSLGLVGLLVKYSPDVGAALRSLVRNMHLHVRGGVTSLELVGGVAALSHDVYQVGAEAIHQIGDGAVAISFNILRTLCGPEWKPSEVRFAHGRPADVGPYRTFFRAPLRFDAGQNAVAFPLHWLAHPLPGADPELSRLLQREIEVLDERHGDEFPDQVRSVLRTALLSDHGRAEQVAALFSMHSRTLNRRLNGFGTSFQKLADEGRFEITRQMLEDSTMNVSQIAELLDYADASAFTRAFRRWSGTTPARWRIERRARILRKG
jgi:AraC-like DNA-binding protein